MEIIKTNIPLKNDVNKIFNSYFQNANLTFFDIETTGLSSKNSSIILIGVISVKDNIVSCIQFLSNTNSLSEEKKIIEAFINMYEKADVIFSYNGDAFDIPFINSRAMLLDIPYCIKKERSYDLYKIAKNSYLKELLPNLQQTTVERLFSTDRKDEISGGESVKLYYQYLKNKNTALKSKILLHNFDDIRMLYEMLGIFDKIDTHKVAFDNGFCVSTFTDGKQTFLNGITYTGHSFSAFYYANDKKKKVEFLIETKEKYIYADLTPIVDDITPFRDLPTFHKNFLILAENGKYNYKEINLLFSIICSEKFLNL